MGSHLRECVQAAEKRAAKVEGTVLEVVLMPGVKEGLRRKYSSSRCPLPPSGASSRCPHFFPEKQPELRCAEKAPKPLS